MSKYIEENLINGEEIQYLAKVSFWSQLPLFVVGVIGLAFYGLGIILLIIGVLNYVTTELAITNKRVIAKFGFIRRNTVELNNDRVESIQVDQSVLGRILNFGDVLVAGGGNPSAPIPGISSPLKFRKAFFEIQDATKN